MVQKIILTRETAEAENNHDFIINGRTDALRSENRDKRLKIAIQRANQYLEAGADLAFVTYVETLDEVKEIVKGLNGPVSIAAGMPYNINNFTIADLVKCGATRLILPTLLIFSSLQGIGSSLEHLDNDKLQKFAENGLLYPNSELIKLLKI